MTKQQLSQLRRFIAQCKKHDDGHPPLYFHLLSEERTTNSNVLYYQDSTLIGFAAVYFFYTDACEISLLVHPKHRRQHIAFLLIQQLLPLLSTHAIQRVIFSSSINFSWLSHLGLQHIESEYHMERKTNALVPIVAPKLTIRAATMADIPALQLIEQHCFPETQNNRCQHFITLLQQPSWLLLIAQYQAKIIGKVHLRQEKTRTFLSDIAILPAFQKQGFGSELLAHTINRTLTTGETKLALDVSANNQFKAIDLYLRQGFEIVLQYEYWTISFEQLQSLINKVTD